MKLAIATLLIGSAAAFAPIAQPAFKLNALSAVVTGKDGKAASSKEEDLELTLQIILKTMGGESDDKEDASDEKSEE
jgi:hypothetical protein